MVKQRVDHRRRVIHRVLDLDEDTCVRMRLGRVLIEMREQGGEGRQPIDISLGSTEMRQEMCVHNKSIELQTNSTDQLRWTIEIQ